MKHYISDNIIAVYVTDADGVPTKSDILDWQGVSMLNGDTISPPNAFATNQWSLATGSNPREITINVSVLPANNGAAITGIDYSIDSGAWVALDGAGTGPRTITAATAGASYSIRLRARNMSGASDPSSTKAVTSGAPAVTAPAAFAAGDWTLTTGLGANELVLSISALPSNGGSAITALQYQIGAGSWTALSGTGAGARILTMAAAGTSYSINLRAVNAVGSAPASTAKTATSGAIAAPTLTAPLPDITLTQGAANVTTDLRDHFTGATTYAVSPTGQGVTISGYTMTSSAAELRDGDYTVTATNSSGSVSDTFAFLVSAQPALTATLSPNPPVAEQLLTITFSTAPDTVTATLDGSAITVSGSGTEYSVTPATVGELIVTATKAGFDGYTDTVTVLDSQDVTLSVEDVDGTPVIDGAGNLTFEITAPAIYAGTYTTDAFVENLGAALNAEYINDTAPQALKGPVIYRYAGPGSPTDNFPGTEYRFDPELLAVKSGAPVTVDYAWFEDGVDTGYDGDSFSRAGIGPVYLEAYVQVEGQALRTIRSNEIVGEEYQTWTDFSGAADGTDLNVFADASNRAWTSVFGTALIYTGVDGGGQPVDTYVRGTSNLGAPYVYYSPTDIGAIEAEAFIQMPAASAYTGGECVGVALHIQDSGGGGIASENLVFYNATVRLRDSYLWIGRKAQGAHGTGSYVAIRSGVWPGSPVMGTVVHLRLRREGDDIVVYNGTTELHRATDTTLTGGGAGLSFLSNTASVANRVLPFGLYQFNAYTE